MRVTYILTGYAVMAVCWFRAGVYLVDPQAWAWSPLVWTVAGLGALLVAVDQVGRYLEGR